MKNIGFFLLAFAATIPAFSQVIQTNTGAGIPNTIKSGGSPSMTGNVANALMVIDGVVMGNRGGSKITENTLSILKPDNIDSMSVLEPAKAMAIYGSAAQNGAILVFTRKRAQPDPVYYNSSVPLPLVK